MLCSWAPGALGEAIEECSVGDWGRGTVGGWGRPPDEELMRFIQMKRKRTAPQAIGQPVEDLESIREAGSHKQVLAGPQQRGR